MIVSDAQPENSVHIAVYQDGGVVIPDTMTDASRQQIRCIIIGRVASWALRFDPLELDRG